MSVPGVEPSMLEDLAAASRILVDQGVFDQAGHTSMRHPGHAERFLMSRSLAPASTTAADIDRKSTRLNSSHSQQSRMPSSA